MLISDFDYELPQELIARYPTEQRRASRLLEVGDGLHDRQFSDLPTLLRPGDLLVFNDTRVIHARLRGRKETGGRCEVLVERVQGEAEAIAQVRASKSPKPGSTLLFAEGVIATVTGREGEFFTLEFTAPILPFLEQHGEVPLPPYLERDAESADDERYQTVYARDLGAVAAPTAGLHFDDAMLAETAAAGVRHAFVTLHVGAGTFQALRHEDVEANRLHSERLVVDDYLERTEDPNIHALKIPGGASSLRRSAEERGNLRSHPVLPAQLQVTTRLERYQGCVGNTFRRSGGASRRSSPSLSADP